MPQQTLASHQPRQRLCPLGPPAKEDFAFVSGKRGKREMQALDLLDTEQLPLSQMEQIKTLVDISDKRNDCLGACMELRPLQPTVRALC